LIGPLSEAVQVLDPTVISSTCTSTGLRPEHEHDDESELEPFNAVKTYREMFLSD